MALSNFFRINLPYGISRNSDNKWVAFNREYKPLGWNDSFDQTFFIHNDNLNLEYPIYTKYKALTETKLREIAGSDEMLKFDEEGKISRVFLYNDKTNPSNPNSTNVDWENYFGKVKKLSIFLAIK